MHKSTDKNNTQTKIIHRQKLPTLHHYMNHYFRTTCKFTIYWTIAKCVRLSLTFSLIFDLINFVSTVFTILGLQCFAFETELKSQYVDTPPCLYAKTDTKQSTNGRSDAHTHVG